MYHLLLYDLVDDYLQRRPAFRDRHLSLARAAHQRGDLVIAGALAEPCDMALLVFRRAEDADNFAREDPYVAEGLVNSWRVRPWAVVVGGD